MTTQPSPKDKGNSFDSKGGSSDWANQLNKQKSNARRDNGDNKETENNHGKQSMNKNETPEANSDGQEAPQQQKEQTPRPATDKQIESERGGNKGKNTEKSKGKQSMNKNSGTNNSSSKKTNKSGKDKDTATKSKLSKIRKQDKKDQKKKKKGKNTGKRDENKELFTGFEDIIFFFILRDLFFFISAIIPIVGTFFFMVCIEPIVLIVLAIFIFKQNKKTKIYLAKNLAKKGLPTFVLFMTSHAGVLLILKHTYKKPKKMKNKFK